MGNPPEVGRLVKYQLHEGTFRYGIVLRNNDDGTTDCYWENSIREARLSHKSRNPEGGTYANWLRKSFQYVKEEPTAVYKDYKELFV